MKASFRDPDQWSLARWTGIVLLAFAVHVGLIFAFGSRKPVLPRAVTNAPSIQFQTARTQLQALEDPTLFALPHPQGFAGASWLREKKIEFPPFRWSEPARQLELPADQLAGTLFAFVQTNRVLPRAINPLPASAVTRVVTEDGDITLRTRSTARVNGGLRERAWLNPPGELPSWATTNLITNSIVQVLADPEGVVLSAALLVPTGSGLKEADRRAVEIARTAKFAPLSRSDSRLAVGTMIFEWHAVAANETNGVPTKP